MIKLKKVFIFFIAILCSFCNKKDEVVNTEKIYKNANHKNLVLDYHEKHFKKLRKKMDRIEISLYKISGNKTQDTTKRVSLDKILNKNKIKEFDLLFQQAQNKGYCCCPKTHYIIDLFKQKNRLKRFNVDTSRVKDKAFIFDTSYQTSYLIPLNVWNDYITSSRATAKKI